MVDQLLKKFFGHGGIMPCELSILSLALPFNFCVNTRKTSGISAKTYAPLLLHTQTPELETSAGPSTYFMAGPHLYSTGTTTISTHPPAGSHQVSTGSGSHYSASYYGKFFFQTFLCFKFMDLICLLDDPLIAANTSGLPWTDGLDLEKEGVDRDDGLGFF
jgi:hypothetical protein